jgi:hypothetical protein
VAVPLWLLLLQGQFALLDAWCEFVQVHARIRVCAWQYGA